MPTKKPKKKKKPVKAKAETKSVKKSAAKILVYFCDGNCTVSEDQIHLGKNDILHMYALGTAVTLDFLAPSPFKGGKAKTIDIPKNSFATEVIGNKVDSFSYSISCDECPSGTDDAEIIVDPGPGGGQ